MIWHFHTHLHLQRVVIFLLKPPVRRTPPHRPSSQSLKEHFYGGLRETENGLIAVLVVKLTASLQAIAVCSVVIYACLIILFRGIIYVRMLLATFVLSVLLEISCCPPPPSQLVPIAVVLYLPPPPPPPPPTLYPLSLDAYTCTAKSWSVRTFVFVRSHFSHIRSAVLQSSHWILHRVTAPCYSTVLQHRVTAPCYSTVLQHRVTARLVSTSLKWLSK